MDSLFFDFSEITPPQKEPSTEERIFIRKFLRKLKIEFDEYNELMISNVSPLDFSFFVLYIIREYRNERIKDLF